MLEQILQAQDAFKPRADDILLATFPKCGTTWLKALTFTVINRSRYSFSGDHPLLTCHSHRLVPFIEIAHHRAAADFLETLPSPRLIATHMPMSLLPPGTSSSACRIVYLCRDPKDALVSMWKFHNSVDPGSAMDQLDKPFSMFADGFSMYGPFWDHCLEYWRESLARPNNVLFLKYEDIKSDPVQVVTKLAEFFGVPFTEEEEKSGVGEEVVRLCSFEMLAGLQVNQVGGVDIGHKKYISNSVFFRKGEVGDWANHMSEEMAEKLDCIVQEKLKGSGLSF